MWATKSLLLHHSKWFSLEFGNAWLHFFPLELTRPPVMFVMLPSFVQQIEFFFQEQSSYYWRNGYPKPGFRVPAVIPWRNGLNARFFFIFCQIFAIFDDLSKCSISDHNLEKNIKFGKKCRINLLFDLTFEPIFRLILGTRKSDFEYPFHQ